jgi:hypothetical protein
MGDGVWAATPEHRRPALAASMRNVKSVVACAVFMSQRRFKRVLGC